jgi:hypothetical protein
VVEDEGVAGLEKSMIIFKKGAADGCCSR